MIDQPPTDTERQPCEIWNRVMGYHRPVSMWNRGKQQEHRDRRYFRESLAFQSQRIGVGKEESE